MSSFCVNNSLNKFQFDSGFASCSNKSNKKTYFEKIKIEKQNPKEITQSIVRLSRSKKWVKLFDYCKDYFNNMNHIHVATALSNFARAPRIPRDLTLNLLEKAEQKIKEFEPRHLNNLLWSIEKLHLNQPQLCKKLGQQVIVNIDKFKSFELSSILLSFAKLKTTDSGLIKILTEAVNNNLKQMNAQSLANCATAYSLLADQKPKDNSFCEKMLGSIWNFASKQLDKFKHMELSSLASSLSTFELKADWGTPIAQTVIKKLSYFNSRSVTVLTSAFVQKPLINERLLNKLFDKIAFKVEKDIRYFQPQALSTIAFKFARIKMQDPKLFRLIADEAIFKIEGFNSRDLAYLAIAFARANYRDDQLFKAIADRAFFLVKNNEFNISDIHDLIWSFSTMNFEDVELFDCFRKSLENNLNKLSSITLTKLAEGYAKSSYNNSQWNQSLAKQAESMYDHFKLETRVRIGWALALMGQLKECPRFVKKVLEITPQTCELLSLDQQFKLLQFMVAAKTQVKANLNKQIITSLEKSRQDPGVSSNFHLSVTTILKKLKPGLRNEYLIESTFYVDIAYPDEKLAIEVDGPSHFSRISGRELGNSRFKKSTLEQLGWKVISIHYLDWERLYSDKDCEEFLKKKL